MIIILCVCVCLCDILLLFSVYCVADGWGYGGERKEGGREGLRGYMYIHVNKRDESEWEIKNYLYVKSSKGVGEKYYIHITSIPYAATTLLYIFALALTRKIKGSFPCKQKLFENPNMVLQDTCSTCSVTCLKADHSRLPSSSTFKHLQRIMFVCVTFHYNSMWPWLYGLATSPLY